jgi:hypothetical protein
MGSFPWYEIVEGETLEQGDIFFKFPLIVPLPDMRLFEPSSEAEVRVEIHDLILMTQSCDLVNDKTQQIIFCPHWGITEVGEIDPELGKKNAWNTVRKGQRARYSMLNSSDQTQIPMEIRIIDFGMIFNLPKDFIVQAALRQGPRLRLMPPYREHLSQAFARYFMRVGLPQDIELP